MNEYEYEALTPSERREAWETFQVAANVGRGHPQPAGTTRRDLLRAVDFGRLDGAVTEGAVARLREAIEAGVAA
jgi:hypothetical protein